MVEVVTSPDAHAAFAERAAALIEALVAERGRARLAVTGGSAARAVEDAFARLVARGVDLSRVLVTWIHERCVPPDAPDSNRGTLREMADTSEKTGV